MQRHFYSNFLIFLWSRLFSSLTHAKHHAFFPLIPVAPGPLGPRGLGFPLNLDLTKRRQYSLLTEFLGPSWVKEGTLDFFRPNPPPLFGEPPGATAWFHTAWGTWFDSAFDCNHLKDNQEISEGQTSRIWWVKEHPWTIFPWEVNC